MRHKVKVYDFYNNTREWVQPTKKKAREYAKRIITEGLWYKEEEGGVVVEVFLPVHRVVKVKVIPVETQEQALKRLIKE